MYALRYALRLPRRSPGLAALTILTLAVGIGATTAIYSVLEAILLRPLPVASPDRLVAVWEWNYKRDAVRNVVNPANFVQWRERATALEDLAGVGGGTGTLGVPYSVTFSGRGEPARIPAGFATGNLFQVLGVSASLGRALEPADSEPGARRVVVLGHGFWQRQFGGEPSVIGTNVMLNAQPATIVGVMPAAFQIPPGAEVFLPLTIDDEFRKAGGRWMSVIGRLAPGATLDAARVEMDTIAKQLEQEVPERDAGWGVTVTPLQADLTSSVSRSLTVLMGAALAVLLIGCANVSNLLLSRALSREREVAVRAALGAGRRQIIWQLMAETLVLAGLGCLGGLLLASWGLSLLLALVPIEVALIAPISLNATVVAVSIGLSLLAALVAGLAPAFHTSRPALNPSLKEGMAVSTSHRGQRLRRSIVVAETALALVLLVGASLLLRSFWALRTIDPGFRTERVATAQIWLQGDRYRDAARQREFFEAVERRVQSLPGVRAAGAISWRPLSTGSATTFRIGGRPEPRPGDEPVADVRMITPGLLSALGIPLRAGRPFRDSDTTDAPSVVIVNETLARQYWPNVNPIGQRIKMEWFEDMDAEVIGVVGDVRLVALDTAPRATLYWPQSQLTVQWMTLAVRTELDPLSLVPAIRRQIAELDPDVAVTNPETLDATVSHSLARPRFLLVLLGAFAITAILLAAIGLYGVMAYAVGQRQREIGLRLALGATRGDILRMVAGEGAWLTAAGIVFGMLAAFLVTRWVESLLFNITPTDPVSFAGVVLLLAVVAGAATWMPARRAVDVDPMQALRTE